RRSSDLKIAPDLAPAADAISILEAKNDSRTIAHDTKGCAHRLFDGCAQNKRVDAAHCDHASIVAHMRLAIFQVGRVFGGIEVPNRTGHWICSDAGVL